MLLKENGKMMELRVTGYEFPDAVTSTKDVYDANWLMVELTYTENGRTETYSGADLLTWEVTELAYGISRLAHFGNLAPSREFCFTEPFLSFRVEEQDGGFTVELRRTVGCVGDGKTVSVKQRLTKSELLSFEHELLEILARYPER